MDGDFVLLLCGAVAMTEVVIHNPGFQAMGSWARYLHAEVEADDEPPWNTSYWRLG